MNIMWKTVFPGLLLVASQAQALEYNQVQINQSALTFGYRQMGVAMDGKFNKFSAQISFDPAKLANAQARIDVNLASIDTGSTDADEEVAGRLWFNTRTYPLASFVSSGIKYMGGNHYQASGKISIKGRTLDITAPVTVQIDGNKGLFDGSFNIKRLAYEIGTGEWADLGTVADDIQIKFHLVVIAAPAAASPSSTQPVRKKP
ncbi:MAG: YceI family protein [Gallionella sp.]|jgi:polyisoprenoid-binding protein YceI